MDRINLTRNSKSMFPATRKRSSFLQPTKRTPAKPSSSGRSVQSNQIIFKTPFHVVENFGTSLPVHVREALTFADKNVAVSVCVSAEGWAWFVCGRRLLIWQCKQHIEDGRRRPINSQCRELTLPSSDLAYRAELVIIYMSAGNQVPSCIAVSPEGIVRYWPSIAHEGSSVEVNADLQGQECDSLTDVSPIGCVLATTTATIVLLQPQISGGRHGIICRSLKLPQGWLGGISRRMSSLFFGSLQSSQILETKLIKVIAVKGTGYGSEEWILYVLAGHTLQKWILVTGELERLVYELDINRFAVDAFQKTIWEPCGGNPSEIQVWLMDMQPTDGGIMILMSAVNSQISPQFYYAFGTVLTDTQNQPLRFDRFCPLKNTGFYRECDEAELLSYRFLLFGTSALLYNYKNVMAVSAINYGEDSDNVEFLGQSDQILGAGLCRNVPVFFSKEHGMVSITPSDISAHDFIMNSGSDMATIDPSSTSVLSEQMNLTVPDLELEEMTENKDSVTQLKAAFLHYVRRNMEVSENIVTSLFQLDDPPAMDVDSPLDTVVLKVSLDLINDLPAGDPRWSSVRASESSLGSSVSLQILNQLEDKQRALEWYFSFLKEVKIWDRLTAVTSRDIVLATVHALSEHAEKLVAAIALRNLHSSHSSLIDQCLKHVVRDEKPPHGLTHQDLFYREVSKMTEFLKVLVQWADTLAHSDRRPHEVVLALIDVNTVLTTVLLEVMQFRKQKTEFFKAKGAFVPKTCEYLVWTSASGSDGLRDSLMLQHSLTLKYGAQLTGDLNLKNKLYEHLVNISDIILDGRKSHVESICGTAKFDVINQQYEASRLAIIKPFLQGKEFERAAVLAEKYYDFHVLIQICELTDNVQRLDQYCEKYADQDFSAFLFNWYIREQKPGRLLEQFRTQAKSHRQKRELAQFLGDHPSLAWVQDIFSGEFKQASNTLQTLAKEEAELVHRKKTMLSLAKLALLASDEGEHVVEDKLNELDSELELIVHQEDLPETVVSAYGYDVEHPRVMTPSEMIKLFICEENQNITEFDFKKALNLLNYIEDEFERNELRHMIWCNAILRDSWSDIDPGSSVDTIANLLFFKLADLMECMGGSAEEFLPPLNRILESKELGELRNDSHFQYLFRLGYERFQKTSSSQD